MKTKALLATLFLAATSAASADDTVEANVILTFKVNEQDAAPVIKGKNSTLSYQTYTLKTADIIQMIGEKEGVTFTKKARLIFQVTYGDLGQNGYSYRIRETGQNDLIVTQYFEDNTTLSVYKFKTSIEKGTGTASAIGLGVVDIPLNGDFEGFYLTGPLKASFRIVQSPTSPAAKIELANLTINLAGRSLLEGTTGYAAGTMKVSGMKILK